MFTLSLKKVGISKILVIKKTGFGFAVDPLKWKILLQKVKASVIEYPLR